MRVLAMFLMFLVSCVGVDASPLTFSQIAPGIYMHTAAKHWPDRENHGEIANIGFIVGERCVAVIDSGGSPQQGISLRHTIRQVTPKPICYLINTHVHPDHIYGNKAFKEPGVKFVGHHKLARAMATRGDHYLGRASELLDIHVAQEDIIPPDIAVNGTLTVDLGNRELVLTAHPSAHTDNDLSVYDKTTDTLWLADLLFLEHIPVIDGSIKGWLSELERLEKNHYKLVIPGHGRLVKDWPESLQPQKAYLNGIATEVRGLIKKGKTLETAVATVGLSAKSDWQLFEQFHRKNVTIAFAELEWEE